MNNYSLNEIDKRHILSIIGDSKDLLNLSLIRLYTSEPSTNNWLYSDLQGILCYVLDYSNRIPLIQLYDSNTYEKLFQTEVYSDFSSYYSKLSHNFHCFEQEQGFIGLKFLCTDEASKFAATVEKMNDSNLQQCFKLVNKTSRKKDRYKKGYHNCEDLKGKLRKDIKLSSVNSELSEEWIKSGMDIIKPAYFELLNNFSYKQDKNIFEVNNLSPEIRLLFKQIGFRKADLKNTEIVLHLFKSFIQVFDSVQVFKKMKTSSLDKVMIINKKNTITNDEDEECSNNSNSSNSEIVNSNFKDLGKLLYFIIVKYG